MVQTSTELTASTNSRALNSSRSGFQVTLHRVIAQKSIHGPYPRPSKVNSITTLLVHSANAPKNAALELNVRLSVRKTVTRASQTQRNDNVLSDNTLTPPISAPSDRSSR